MTKCRIHLYEADIGVCAPCLRDRLLAVIEARTGDRSPDLPLAPPRSVSPRFHQRFFSTPQVDLPDTAKKKRFSLLSLFRSKPRSGSRILGFFSGRSDRGMSPVRGEDDDEYDEESESPTGRRRPDPTPVRRFPADSPAWGGIGVAGFAMCFSPKPTVEIGFSTGDPRDGGGSVFRRRRRKISAGEASLGPNRSKKLADMGRFR